MQRVRVHPVTGDEKEPGKKMMISGQQAGRPWSASAHPEAAAPLRVVVQRPRTGCRVRRRHSGRLRVDVRIGPLATDEVASASPNPVMSPQPEVDDEPWRVDSAVETTSLGFEPLAQRSRIRGWEPPIVPALDSERPTAAAAKAELSCMRDVVGRLSADDLRVSVAPVATVLATEGSLTLVAVLESGNSMVVEARRVDHALIARVLCALEWLTLPELSAPAALRRGLRNTGPLDALHARAAVAQAQAAEFVAKRNAKARKKLPISVRLALRAARREALVAARAARALEARRNVTLVAPNLRKCRFFLSDTVLFICVVHALASSGRTDSYAKKSPGDFANLRVATMFKAVLLARPATCADLRRLRGSRRPPAEGRQEQDQPNKATPARVTVSSTRFGE